MKSHEDNRKIFLRAWKRYIYSISRIKKGRKQNNSTKPVIKDDISAISNPVVTFIEQFSRKKGLVKRFFNKENIIVPKKFNFYDNPEESLIFIHSACKAICRGSRDSYTFDYNTSKYNCLGAEYLLALAVSEARQSNFIINKKVVVNGIYPKKESHREVIKALGIVKELDESSPGEVKDYTANTNNPKQRVFKIDSIGKENASAYAQDRKNKTAEDFSEYINECLSDHDLELKEHAAKYLKSCMGELLDNAERHCGLSQRPRWYVRGYVNNNLTSPVCELAIINFGNTISETFENLPVDHFSNNIQVKPYVSKHLNKRGMFKDGLITIAALQGRVSCKNVTDEDSSGTGTIELLKFFQDMHDNLRELRGSSIDKPKMSLITGNTHLSFDGKYPLICKIDTDDESETFTYPFNHIGLATEPDRAYLREMKDAFFPGVMVNIRFPLQKTSKV